MRQPLTGQQQLLFQLLEWRLAEGRCPTRRELMKLLGVRSTHAVNTHIAALVRKGWISWGGAGRSRNLELPRPA